MKRIAAIILAFSALSFTVVAQETDQPQTFHQHNQQHFHHREMGVRALHLSEDQMAQLKEFNKSYRQQLEALHKNEDITVREYRDKMYALKKERKANLMSILTEEQKVRLAQMKNERMEHRELMAARHLDKMKISLNLTNDQVSKIEEQGKATFEKIRTIHENDNLTREQKKDQLMAIKNESKENFKKILTPDQLNKLEEMKKARMDRSNS